MVRAFQGRRRVRKGPGCPETRPGTVARLSAAGSDRELEVLQGSGSMQRLSEVGARWDPSLGSPSCDHLHQPVLPSPASIDLTWDGVRLSSPQWGRGRVDVTVFAGWGLTCLPVISGGATAQLTGLQPRGASNPWCPGGRQECVPFE